MLFPKFAKGLEAVIYIAINSGADPVSSKQICAYQDVLPRHLEPILQILVKEGILKGTKGPRGGYTLAKEKRKVCISEIFSLLCTETKLNLKNEENIIHKNVMGEINKQISDNIELTLKNYTIEDLCKKVTTQPKESSKTDFNI